jgi:hypothetical protein
MIPLSEVEVAKQSRGLNLPGWVPHFGVQLYSSRLISTYFSILICKETWPLGDVECKAPAGEKRILCFEGLFYGAIADTEQRLFIIAPVT